jgi:hypothetical protein
LSLAFELMNAKREDAPEYSIPRGICRAYSQDHGWQEIRFKDGKVAEVYSTRPISPHCCRRQRLFFS